MLPDLIVILAFHLIICLECCHGSWTMRSCQCILQSNFITTVDYENAQLLVTYKGASLCVVFFVICCQSSIKQCQCLWSGETISWLNARWNKLCNSATNQPCKTICFSTNRNRYTLEASKGEPTHAECSHYGDITHVMWRTRAQQHSTEGSGGAQQPLGRPRRSKQSRIRQ